MKRSGFKPKTLDEVKAKQATKRQKLASKAHKTTKTRKVPSKPKKTVRKEKTQAQLKKELDRVFSIYIRQKFSKNGICECYTCGQKLPIKKIQNGHFISRQYLVTRWDENNCRPQCWGCNGFGNGKPLDFEERLKKDLGNDFVEEMKMSRHQSLKLDRHWYKEQIDKYKLLITE